MLSDSPSNYYREPDMMAFLSQVPTTWDETRALQGKVAEYVLVARRKGNDWYLGGMNNDTARDVDVDLSFLPAGEYTADIFMDGVNADRYASDYRRVSEQVTADSVLKAAMAPGGGWAARIRVR
jgi:alpha-glucosidase